MKYCELCGIYPATTVKNHHGQKKWLCDSCNHKNKASLNKIEIYKEFETCVKERTGLNLNHNNYPDDFSEIGDSCGAKGYLGFIYADGNAMGKILQNILNDTPNDDKKLTVFSNGVEKATKQGIIEAVLDNIPQPVSIETEDRGSTEIFPVEFIIAGGDDLVIAVPASKVLQITLDFIDNFEKIYDKEYKKEYGQKNNQGATTSCGVVIVKST